MSSIEKTIERLKREGGSSVKNAPNEYLTEDMAKNYVTKSKVSENEKSISNNEIINKNRILNINTEKLKQLGYICPDDMASQIAEEYRVIKRPLLLNAFGKGAAPIENGNLIAILSAEPGEGKTFTSLNLALSIAMEKNTTILLVDTDVTNPSLSRIFNMEEQPGLLDVLSDNLIDVSNIIHKTNIPTLSVIPAGRGNPHAAELLASQGMYDFVNEIVERYADRIILFDAPPILVASHTSILAHIAGQIMVVVEAGKTLQSTIREALSKIDSDKVVGMILNKSRDVFTGRYYGYYGYYGSYGHTSVNKADGIKK